MQLKTWLLIIRILNILCSALMTGFEIWFIIALLKDDKGFFTIVIRMFVPVFVILLAFTIITAQFKYAKTVQHFKFLQFLPGLILFNLFVASLFAFQFSTLENQAATISISVIFACLSIIFSVMYCLKPQGTQSLLAADD